MGNGESKLDSRDAALDARVGDSARLIGTLRSYDRNDAAVLYFSQYLFFVHFYLPLLSLNSCACAVHNGLDLAFACH